MSTHRVFAASAVVVAVLAAGCAPVILITKPDRNKPNDPVDAVTVDFTSNFVPTEAWYVNLDGSNLGGFSPAAGPGKTSSVPVSITTAGAHTVTAQGTCGAFCSYQSDEVSFTPPALMYNSISYANGSQNLKQFQSANVFVGVQNFRSIPISVTIVETTTPKHVKLAPAGGAFLPPGAPLTLTIGAATTKADFVIEGDVLGPYQLRFTSPGSVEGFGAGTVSP